MARFPCTFPGARPAVGPRWLPARMARRAARPAPSSAFCSFRMGLTAIGAIQYGLVAAFERKCPIHAQAYDHVGWLSSIRKLRLKLGSGSRLLTATKSPPRAGREGLLMPRRAIGHGRAVTAPAAVRVASRAAGARAGMMISQTIVRIAPCARVARAGVMRSGGRARDD